MTHEVKQLRDKVQELQKNNVIKEPVRERRSTVDKGEVFLKWEKAMLYKEKIHVESKKGLNRMFSSLGE